MKRILLTGYFWLYLLPFTIFFFSYPSLRSVIVLSTILFGYVLLHTSSVRLPELPRSNKLVFWFLFLTYLLLKHEVILTYVEDIISGHFLSGLQERAVARYTSNTGLSVYIKLSRVLLYVMSPLLVTARLKGFSITCVSLIIVFLESYDLARAPALLFGVLLLSDFSLLKNDYFNSLSRVAFYRKILIILAALFFFFILVSLGRVQDEDELTRIVLTKIGEYSLSMYLAFYDWLNNSSFSYWTFDMNTFFALKRFFTGEVAVDGFYEDTVYTYFGSTVVFTNLRVFISDLGVFFPFIVLLMIYLLGRRYSWGLLIINRLLIVFVLFPLNSPFVYTVFFVGFFLGWLIYVFTSKVPF